MTLAANDVHTRQIFAVQNVKVAIDDSERSTEVCLIKQTNRRDEVFLIERDDHVALLRVDKAPVKTAVVWAL
jgi:hypothetical protein